jgi:hypothetical protein
MIKELDLKESFNAYLNEVENYGLRVERLELELDTIMGIKRLLEWMQAAYNRGASDMANDTLHTLADYSTALSGLNHASYTASEAFDAAAENLQDYYKRILKDE